MAGGNRQWMLERPDGSQPSMLAALIAFGLTGLLTGVVVAFLPFQYASWLGFRLFGFALESGLAIGAGLFAAASVAGKCIRWWNLGWFVVAGLGGWLAYTGISTLVDALNSVLGSRLVMLFCVWVPVLLVLYLLLGWKFVRPSLRTRQFGLLILAQAAVFALSDLIPNVNFDDKQVKILVAMSPDGSIGPEVRSLHADLSIILTACRISAMIFISVALMFGPWFANPKDAAKPDQSTA